MSVSAGRELSGDPDAVDLVETSDEPIVDPTDQLPVRRRMRPTIPEVLVAVMVVAWTWYFTDQTLDIHHALGTSSYDSGLYDQGMWLLSRFDAPFVTLMGRNLFGDHSSFILLFLVPFYWIAPGAWILFFSQSLVLALGAVPVFLYGRRRLGSEWWALAAAATYLLHPAVGWTNRENFHPDSFLGVFVGAAIYAALERKWRTYAVFVVLALLVKEDAVLVLAPLGVWVALRRDRRIGLLTIAGSIAFALAAMYLVMRSLIGVPTRNAWRIPFGGPSGVVDTAVTNPTDLVEHLTSEERPWYLWQMTAPFAWLFLRLPDVAAISALVLFTNILSTFWYQHQIEYHYSLVAVPALAIGTVYAIGAISRRWSVTSVDPHHESHHESPAARTSIVPARQIALVVLVAASLAASYLWSPLPWGRTPLYIGDRDNVYAVEARSLMDQIPDDAVVSAFHQLTPHLAYRPEIYQFPNPFRVVLYGPNTDLEGTRLDDRAERVEYVMLPTSQDPELQADWAVVAPAFELVDATERWALYERDPAVELPTDPAAELPSG
jgi:uncharacterized membrane protein